MIMAAGGGGSQEEDEISFLRTVSILRVKYETYATCALIAILCIEVECGTFFCFLFLNHLATCVIS